MKGTIEFVLISLGDIMSAFLGYKITSIPFIFGIIGSNVLVVNIIGSFILGIFSIFSSSLKIRFQIFFFNSRWVMRFVDYHVIASIRNIVLFENNKIIEMVINTISNVVLSFLFLYIGSALLHDSKNN